MRTIYFLLALLLLSSIGMSAYYTYQPNIGPHGGTVKEVENFNIEVKISTSSIYAFLLDKKLKPINNKGIFCEIKFFPPDNIPIDVTLKPYQQDGFVLESTSVIYDFFRVAFNVNGKSVSEKFYNENAIVEKK